MRVVALGDSITQGYLCNPRDSWVSIVERELGITMINLGVCGDLTENMYSRLRHQVRELIPSHCVILGGTNDAFCGIPLRYYKNNIEEMVEYCLNYSIIPILGIPTPCLSYPEEELLQAYRDWLKEYSAIKELTVIDFYNVLVDAKTMKGKQEYFLDEVHPNKKGYRTMADAAKVVLKKMLPKR